MESCHQNIALLEATAAVFAKPIESEPASERERERRERKREKERERERESESEREMYACVRACVRVSLGGDRLPI
jgi:hypothetical protein